MNPLSVLLAAALVLVLIQFVWFICLMGDKEKALFTVGKIEFYASDIKSFDALIAKVKPENWVAWIEKHFGELSFELMVNSKVNLADYLSIHIAFLLNMRQFIERLTASEERDPRAVDLLPKLLEQSDAKEIEVVRAWMKKQNIPEDGLGSVIYEALKARVKKLEFDFPRVPIMPSGPTQAQSKPKDGHYQ